MKSSENKKFYNQDFYNLQTENSLQSAREILSLVFTIYKPESIVDFGCGQGTWLTAADELGVKKLQGYDGEWIDCDKLYSHNICFESVNLEAEIITKEKFDLAISLEVAEHLKESSAEIFIESLCNSSDVVLFGAAVKGQAGSNHINTQWQSYWVHKFKKNDFACYDIVRAQVWNNKKIERWYKQNTFLFVRNNAHEKISKLLMSLERDREIIYDIVHPELFEHRIMIKDAQIEKNNEIISKKSDETMYCNSLLLVNNIQLEKSVNHTSKLIVQLEKNKQLIRTMEASKFWRLRESYLNYKKK